MERIKELTLEVHAMVHPAEISERSEKTIADIRIKTKIYKKKEMKKCYLLSTPNVQPARRQKSG